LKVEIHAPPNSSILLSMLYEGLLYIKSRCSDANDQCLKGLWDKDVKFNFVGNDIRHTLEKELSKRYNVQLRDFKSFVNFMKNIVPQDLVIYVRISDKQFLVGDERFVGGGIKGYSFQIMKADRYKGITSLELNLIDEEVTVYSDINGLYLFFLGLLSSYITTVGNDYYFLFFDTGELPRVLQRPNMVIIKNSIANDLRDVLNHVQSLNDELITLSVLLNIMVIKIIKDENVRFTSLRLVRIKNEGGKTYKVYDDMPLQIFADQKIYENEDELQQLNYIMKRLITPASRFIRGNDRKGDGYHAYLALKYLYSYIITGNTEYLEKFYRELHEADKINSEEGYLRWVSQRFIWK